MPTGVQRLQQLPLAQRQQAQHVVIHRQFALALELAEQATAITAGGLQRAAGNRSGQCRRA
ncbi:hypothetical protein D9M71_691880 [compost metagenome]